MTQTNDAPQKKEDRRVRRTKKLLTQALTQLLQEKQINEITVKELTDLADMNRGTFPARLDWACARNSYPRGG